MVTRHTLTVHTTSIRAVQSKLEREVGREKALAEAEGRIKENRENEDVNRRAMQLRLEEERKKLVEAINATFTNLGQGTVALLTDKERLGSALAGLTLLALGVYSAREGTRVAGQVFSRSACSAKLSSASWRTPRCMDAQPVAGLWLLSCVYWCNAMGLCQV